MVEGRMGLFIKMNNYAKLFILSQQVYSSLIFSFEDFLDVVEFVEGFNGCNVVDVEREDFVADLGEYGVVELVERELHTFACVG